METPPRDFAGFVVAGLHAAARSRDTEATRLVQLRCAAARSVYVHRMVAVRSSAYFETALATIIGEHAADPVVYLPEADARVVTLIVDWMYTGDLELDDDDPSRTLAVMRLARFLQIGWLEPICADSLGAWIRRTADAAEAHDEAGTYAVAAAGTSKAVEAAEAAEAAEVDEETASLVLDVWANDLGASARVAPYVARMLNARGLAGLAGLAGSRGATALGAEEIATLVEDGMLCSAVALALVRQLPGGAQGTRPTRPLRPTWPARLTHLTELEHALEAHEARGAHGAAADEPFVAMVPDYVGVARARVLGGRIDARGVALAVGALDVGGATLDVAVERAFPFRVAGSIALPTSLSVRACGLTLAVPTTGRTHRLERDAAEQQMARVMLGGAWRAFARLPPALVRAGPFLTLAHGESVYVVGSRDATFARLDVRTATFELLPSPSVARRSCAAAKVVVGARTYVYVLCGAALEGGAPPPTERFLLDGRESGAATNHTNWEQMPALAPRTHCAAVALGASIYVLGGVPPAGHATASCVRVDAATGLATPIAPMSVARAGCSAFVRARRVVALGGVPGGRDVGGHGAPGALGGALGGAHVAPLAEALFDDGAVGVWAGLAVREARAEGAGGESEDEAEDEAEARGASKRARARLFM